MRGNMAQHQEVIRVLIVDDHSLVREALAQSIAMEPGIEVVGEARDGAEALHLAEALAPDLILLDFALPDQTGLEVVAALDAAGERPRVLLLTGAPMDEDERALLAGKVEGFLHKESGRDALLIALREVAASPAGRIGADQHEARNGILHAGSLTRRERAVLREIAKGASLETISQILGISAGTARKHRENIMAKLGLSSTAALVRAAMQIGRY